jgi:hypothetical protein
MNPIFLPAAATGDAYVGRDINDYFKYFCIWAPPAPHSPSLIELKDTFGHIQHGAAMPQLRFISPPSPGLPRLVWKTQKLKSNAQVNLGIFKSSSLEHQMFRVNPPLRNKRAKPHQCFPSLGRPRLIEDAIGNRIVLLHRMCKRENDLRTTGQFLRGNRLAGHTTVVTYPWCAIMRLGNSSKILRSLTSNLTGNMLDTSSPGSLQ